MKKIFTLLAVFALTMTAMAQAPALMSASFNNETSIISVELENAETTITSFTFKFQLPDGVAVASKYDEDEGENVDQILRDKNRVAGSKWTWDVRPAAGGKTMVTCFGGTLKNVETTKRIVTIELTGDIKGVVEFTEAQVVMDGEETNLADFTCPLAAVTDPVVLTGIVEDGNLVFKYENNSGKQIANCNFQLKFDEGVSIAKKSNGKPNYKKGGATEEMESASCAYNESTGKYTFAIYGGIFDDTADGVIVSFPLEGDLTNKNVVVSNIGFGDPDEANICRPAEFVINLDGTAINSISADQTKSGVIYNLSGQRVSKATKGIFIIDGKKVAVK